MQPIGQIIAVTLIASLAGMESVLDEWQWHRPLLVCTLIGIALGSLHTGLLIGGELELLALGWMNIGAAQSPDTALAGVFATLLAVRAGHDTSSAIALSIPIAMAGNLSTVLVRSLVIPIHHVADRITQKSPSHYFLLLHIGALLFQAMRVAVPAFLFEVFLNKAIILDIFHSIPNVVQQGFTVASGFVVVVGYAMVIRSLRARELTPYLLLGFLLAAISSTTLVTVGVIAGCLAWLHVRLWSKHDRRAVDISSLPELQTTPTKKISRPVLWRVFWRSQFHQASWNYERMQGLGYAFTMEPALDDLYQDEQLRCERKRQHLEFFNTQPYVANLVIGMNLALEERLSEGKKSFSSLIQSIKLGMMGPLAGVGDSFFWGTLRPLLGSLGAAMALHGNVMGPIFFFVSWNVIRLGSRWGLLFYGYRFGLKMVNTIATGFLRQINEGAAIVGLFVMGALVAVWTHVNFSVPMIDTIFSQTIPKLPNLLLLFFVLWLLRKGWHSVAIILLLFVIAVCGVFVHVLQP